MIEAQDLAVLVDPIVVISHPRIGERVPKVPTLGHPVARIANRGALEVHIDPAAEPGEPRPIGTLLTVAVEIFADQRRLVAGGLEPNGQRILFLALERLPAALIERTVGPDAVIMRSLPGEEGGAAWRTERKIDETVLESDPLIGDERQCLLHVGHRARVFLIIGHD